MLDFRPDGDPTIQGTMSSVTNGIPTNKNAYRQKYAALASSYAALAAASLGLGFVKRLDGTNRLFSGASTAIYEADGVSAWTDETRTVGGAYTAATSWTFAQYGDVSLAASYENILQASNGATGTNFANVTGAPNGKIVLILSDRVLLLNTQGYSGSGQDGWAASDDGDYTNWTPAATNNAANGRLREVGGPITAGNVLGNTAIAWKKQGMWVGLDEGPPTQVSWQKVRGRYGCISNDTQCAIDVGIVFVGPNDIFLYDGSRPRSIATGIRETFFAGGAPTSGLFLQHDEINNVVLFYRSDQAGYVYNYKTDKWGRFTGYEGESASALQAVLRAPNDDLIAFGGLQLSQGPSGTTNFVVNSSRVLTNADGTAAMKSGTSSLFTFWYIGSDKKRSDITEFVPFFLERPDSYAAMSGSVTSVKRLLAFKSQVVSFNANQEEGRLDGQTNGNWHLPSMTLASGAAQWSLASVEYGGRDAGKY